VRKEILDAIIEEKCLLKHPFYQAWNMGTLKTQDIGLYATQYGEFIDRIAAGWETAGDLDTAEEEREHARLWTDFASGLGATRPAEKRLPEIESLVRVADETFSTRAQVLGALYAFEQQQPGTAQSKLDGLNRHYSLSTEAKVYFDIHKDDLEEPQWLADQIETLSPEEFDAAEVSCRRMAAALWVGLDGVMSAIDA
jgi:pyrroloquinoline-quinone synthase